MISGGLGSQPEMEAGSRQWKHQILAPRPVVSDKDTGSLASLRRISTKMESSEASKVFTGRKKSTECVDRRTGRLREESRSCWVTPSWQFELLWWSISSRFPLANHYDLPGSQSIFGASQDPFLCTHVSLSQDGFYHKGLWVENPLPWLLWLARSLFCESLVEGVSRLWNEKSVQGSASSLNCPAILVLEFLSIENESPIALPWGTHLPPASNLTSWATAWKYQISLELTQSFWVRSHTR